MIDQLSKQLRQEEGEVLHAYKDHMGFLTIGVGRLIDQKKGGGITKEESAYLLANDIKKVVSQLERALPWFNQLNDARKAVLCQMCFQMGLAGLLDFKNTLKAIQNGEWAKAASGMQQSLWAKQTPARAKRLADQMLTGNWVWKD